MSNPWVRSTPAVWPHGPGQSPDVVTGMASGTAFGLGRVWAENLGLITPLGDLILPPWKITTGAGSVSGTIERWLILSEDGVLWTAGIDPTANADQSALLTAFLAYDPNALAARIDLVTVSAAATAYYFREMPLAPLLGNVPRYWSVLINNLSGQALSATAAQHVTPFVAESYA